MLKLRNVIPYTMAMTVERTDRSHQLLPALFCTVVSAAAAAALALA